MSKHKWESPISDEQIGFIPSCVICGAEFGASSKTCADYMAQMTADMAKFIPAPPIDWKQRAIEAEQISDELVKALTAEITNLQAAKQQAEQLLGHANALIKEQADEITDRENVQQEQLRMLLDAEQKARALEGALKLFLSNYYNHHENCAFRNHFVTKLCNCRLLELQHILSAQTKETRMTQLQSATADKSSK